MKDMVIYNYGLTLYLGAVPTAFLTILFITVDMSLLHLSYKETNALVMSQKLKKIQRRFLLQLSLQAFIPFLLICIPTLAAIVAFSWEIFGTTCKLLY